MVLSTKLSSTISDNAEPTTFHLLKLPIDLQEKAK
jgi:hypothetical protein